MPEPESCIPSAPDAPFPLPCDGCGLTVAILPAPLRPAGSQPWRIAAALTGVTGSPAPVTLRGRQHTRYRRSLYAFSTVEKMFGIIADSNADKSIRNISSLGNGATITGKLAKS